MSFGVVLVVHPLYSWAQDHPLGCEWWLWAATLYSRRTFPDELVFRFTCWVWSFNVHTESINNSEGEMAVVRLLWLSFARTTTFDVTAFKLSQQASLSLRGSTVSSSSSARLTATNNVLLNRLFANSPPLFSIPIHSPTLLLPFHSDCVGWVAHSQIINRSHWVSTSA